MKAQEAQTLTAIWRAIRIRHRIEDRHFEFVERPVRCTTYTFNNIGQLVWRSRHPFKVVARPFLVTPDPRQHALMENFNELCSAMSLVERQWKYRVGDAVDRLVASFEKIVDALHDGIREGCVHYRILHIDYDVVRFVPMTGIDSPNSF